MIRTEGFSHLVVKRQDDRTEIEIRHTSIEAPDGQLLRFDCEMKMGPTPICTKGVVHGDRLDLETGTAGKIQKTSIPWSPDYRGPFADEQSLRDKPMQPGEHRSMRGLAAVFNQLVTIELTAKDFESTSFPNGPQELLHIDKVTKFSNGKEDSDEGQKIEETVWTNRAGEMLRTLSPMMDINTYRITEAEAMVLAHSNHAGEVDLLGITTVKLASLLPQGHRSRQITYRVTLEGGNPADVFVTGPSQQVKSLDPHTAEVTVYAIRPMLPQGNSSAPADPPTDADRQPNSMIQSDDPAIVAEAKKAKDGETEPWRVAVALESYVNRVITKKNYTQTFATASEVAKSHEGDCTEHAVFLAALARACGLPARVAMGLVYMEQQGKGGFGYHMWTEIYMNDRWIPMDGTLGMAGIGAGHLKITQSSLQGDVGCGAFLPVTQVIGRLKIQILAP